MIFPNFLWTDSNFPIDFSKCAFFPKAACYKEVCPAVEVGWAPVLSQMTTTHLLRHLKFTLTTFLCTITSY